MEEILIKLWPIALIAIILILLLKPNKKKK